MQENKLLPYIKNVLASMPKDWLNLTTHRLDIYKEELAKTQFLERFESLFNSDDFTTTSLNDLPTAFDYIRLGHPLSCVLEWVIAMNLNIKADQVISFSSKTTPIYAVLRKNLFAKKNTLIAHVGELPRQFDPTVLKDVYGYNFETKQLQSGESLPKFDGSVILVNTKENICDFDTTITNVDFFVNMNQALGSIIVCSSDSAVYIPEIQHVRRRETIAMTPVNTYSALQRLVEVPVEQNEQDYAANKAKVRSVIQEVTQTQVPALIGSSGLSMQYAIVMGLIHDALENHPGKAIKIVVPPNCYGGTNDQARRVAACSDNIEVVDLPVDGGQDMVQSTDKVLDKIAKEDAVPLIIAEIPTNPRVEVPDLMKLRDALSKPRQNTNGDKAVAPVFILDQTFCPNVHFLGEDEVLASVQTIAYVSGSKFPSGGKCTAGYCTANQKAKGLMGKIEQHLAICDNEATDAQMAILANQMPSMNQRIQGAYEFTRAFVEHIQEQLPDAKINFVSEQLAADSFTPSVFSLDLPTKGASEEEKENYKRALNLKLINRMISEIPEESKFCVSYGQLKGCYWTIPATSTQGTTKEGDKDYIVRVALSSNMDLERHKKVFSDFVESI